MNPLPSGREAMGRSQSVDSAHLEGRVRGGGVGVHAGGGGEGGMGGIELFHQQGEAVELLPESHVGPVSFDFIPESPGEEGGMIPVKHDFLADALGLLGAVRGILMLSFMQAAGTASIANESDGNHSGALTRLEQMEFFQIPNRTVSLLEGDFSISLFAQFEWLQNFALISATRYDEQVQGNSFVLQSYASFRRSGLNGNTGHSRTEARGLVGHIDELAVFPRALSDAEIQTLALTAR